jgi:Ca2+-binding EF-hand superfamily protein
VTDIFAEIDKDLDGKISFPEFCIMVNIITADLPTCTNLSHHVVRRGASLSLHCVN